MRSLGTRQTDVDARLAWFVILGTLPAAVLGLLLHDVVETWLRSPLVIAAATIGFGVLLGVADRITSYNVCYTKLLRCPAVCGP